MQNLLFYLGNIARIRESLSQKDTEILVHAFNITSKLDNSNSLLYGLSQFMIDRLSKSCSKLYHSPYNSFMKTDLF